MTRDEHNAAIWVNCMTCVYKGSTRQIVSADFEEQLIGLKNESDEAMIDYVRCESVIDVTYPKEEQNG